MARSRELDGALACLVSRKTERCSELCAGLGFGLGFGDGVGLAVGAGRLASRSWIEPGGAVTALLSGVPDGRFELLGWTTSPSDTAPIGPACVRVSSLPEPPRISPVDSPEPGLRLQPMDLAAWIHVNLRTVIRVLMVACPGRGLGSVRAGRAGGAEGCAGGAELCADWVSEPA